MIFRTNRIRRAALWAAASFAVILAASVPFSPSQAENAGTSRGDPLSKLTAEQKKTLKAYQAARRAYERKLDQYWKTVERKRKSRRAKMSRGVSPTAADYVAEHPPAYSGPPRPDDIFALLPAPPKPKKPAAPAIPVVKDFLAAAKEEYGFEPDSVTEEEFMIYYAIEAMQLGLTRDQVVRVFALETGGTGTHDLQSGYNPKTGRAASTALGYAQLLAANSVGQIQKLGESFAERLERLASADGIEPEKAERLKKKAAVLRRMAADAKRVPYKWSEHVRFGKSPKGLAMHALNLDGDVGPWLQVTKLKGILDYARRKGRTVLTGAELELMNLAGPGNGFEMLQPVARDMPTANFFERRGYERNPVVHNRTGAELLAKLDEIMDRNLQKDGARQFAVIFDRLAQRTASGSGSVQPVQASATDF